MRFVMVAFVLIGVGGAALYYFGGYESYDPSQQGTAARSAITPGMPWNQVIGVAGKPGKYGPILKKTRIVAGEEIEELVPGVPVKFDVNTFSDAFDGGQFPWGFKYYYTFSRSVAFAVEFDEQGGVVNVHDTMTDKDLFDLKAKPGR